MQPVIIGSAKLILGDCMEYMATLPDNYYQLALVDPPYGIGVGIFEPIGGRGEKNKDSKGWDVGVPSADYFNELRRVSVDQIIWGANYFNCFSSQHGAIIWNKNQPMPDSSQCEIASYSRLKKVGLYTQTWTNYVNTKQTKHPTEKPVKLYEWLLSNYAKPGDRILDTHGGSMSSVIAALKMGYEITCIEKDEDYFNAAAQRVRDSQRTQDMFQPVAVQPEQAVLV